jgi:hypothetical protein
MCYIASVFYSDLEYAIGEVKVNQEGLEFNGTNQFLVCAAALIYINNIYKNNIKQIKKLY